MFTEKSKLLILVHQNVLLVFNFVQKIVSVSRFLFNNIWNNWVILLGTLQYMSPDVVLVPPMGYGPEVRYEKKKSNIWLFRI